MSKLDIRIDDHWMSKATNLHYVQLLPTYFCFFFYLCFLFGGRLWMNCLWKPKQLRKVIVWVLIQQGCRRSMDCRHRQCTLQAVPMTLTLHLKTQSPESLLTRGSLTHHFTQMQILMEVGACTCLVYIQLLIYKTIN